MFSVLQEFESHAYIEEEEARNFSKSRSLYVGRELGIPLKNMTTHSERNLQI